LLAPPPPAGAAENHPDQRQHRPSIQIRIPFRDDDTIDAIINDIPRPTQSVAITAAREAIASTVVRENPS